LTVHGIIAWQQEQVLDEELTEAQVEVRLL
jgi:hypothetical protein